MSLRVDLISPDEKRSGSRINARAFIRLAKILAPVIILFIAGNITMKLMTLSAKMHMLEARWEVSEPKQEHARKTSEQVNVHLKTLEELNAWKDSRIEWNKQLSAIAETTPDSVQLTALVVSQQFDADTPPSPPKRIFTMTINGKTSGEGAMDYIEILSKSLEHHKAMANLINSVDVTDYEADTSENASELDRVFQIDCAYKTQPPEESKQ
jgi:hypothetical protein